MRKQQSAAPSAVSVPGTTVNQVCDIAATLLGVDRKRLNGETSLGDLGADELDYVELVMELEEHFDVSIPDDAAERLLGSEDWQQGLKNVTMAKLARLIDEQRRSHNGAGEVRPQSRLRDSDPWVIRTDFSSDETWKRIRESVAAPQEGGFYAYVASVDDAKFRNRSPQDVVRLLPDDYPAYFCFVADSECIQNSEHPVLVVGFYPSASDYEESVIRKPSETLLGQIAMFRAVPSQIQGIQNNLSIANMDFDEFARSVDPDGVFRGFRR